MAKMTNLERRIARMNSFPAQIQAAVEDQLKVEVDDMVAALKRAAPVSDFEKRPGELRDSITAYPVQGRPASWRIIVKARDEKGRYYGSYVEFGHNKPDGTRAQAQPFFWPTYRARKRGLRVSLRNLLEFVLPHRLQNLREFARPACLCVFCWNSRCSKGSRICGNWRGLRVSAESAEFALPQRLQNLWESARPVDSGIIPRE